MQTPQNEFTEISVENTVKMNTSIRFPKTPDVKDGEVYCSEKG